MNKYVKVKTKKVIKITRKYEITSIDKIVLIKEKLKQKKKNIRRIKEMFEVILCLFRHLTTSKISSEK